jgi:hypothetical protein
MDTNTRNKRSAFPREYQLDGIAAYWENLNRTGPSYEDMPPELTNPLCLPRPTPLPRPELTQLPRLTPPVELINPHKNYLLYLKLKEGKYYIEATSYPNERIKLYLSGQGCKWILKYPVIDALVAESDDLDSEIKRYMRIYGIDNVRGSNISNINLPSQTRRKLNQELFGRV